MFLLFACSSPTSTPAPAPTRGDVAAPAARKLNTAADFCGQPPEATFSWPELAEGAAPAPGAAWTWVNVWATWCKPCIAEMPMLVRWQQQLEAAGVQVALQFLSVDDMAEKVDGFARAHPEIPKGVRIKDVSLVPSWLPKVGLDASAVLPLHFFVDGSQKIRCVRQGSVGDADYDAIKELLGG